MKFRECLPYIGIGALLAAVIVGASRERPVKPELLADVNGDGVRDAIIFSQDPLIANAVGYDFVCYIDGRDIRKEGTEYFARGFPTRLAGPLRNQDTLNSYRYISIGNYDKDPRLDIRVTTNYPDLHGLPIEEDFYNRLPPKQSETGSSGTL